MDQDFPLKLFPTIDLSREKEPKTDVTEFISKIYPNIDLCDSLDFNYDENLHEITCLTHKYHSIDSFNAKTPLLPWSLAKSYTHGIRPYENDFVFEDICCKSTLGKFARDLFGGGLSGKCVYVKEHNIWLTPVEFLTYAGSTRAEWKAGIQFKSFAYRARREIKSIKSEINAKQLKAHNEFCTCSICSDSDSMQHDGQNYLESFTKDGGNLIHLYPSADKLNQLTIETSRYRHTTNVVNFLSERSVENVIGTVKYDFDGTADKQIKEIRRQNDFDEDFFFVNIRHNLSSFKTIRINKDLTEIDVVFSKEFKKRIIKSIQASPHIKGEFAICLNNELMLQSDNLLKSITKLTPDHLQPLFECKTSTRRNLTFGSHPRNFVYSDHSRVTLIDARLPNAHALDLFTLSKDSKEIIELNCTNEADLNQHIICGTKSIHLIDERFKSRSLLSWKHDLKKRPNSIHIKQYNSIDHIFLNNIDSIYHYQFSTKKYDIPILHSSSYNLDTLRDMRLNLPNNYDKRFNRHLDYRCNKPLVGMSVLNDYNLFAVFQMHSNCELYYQCFHASEKKEPKIDMEFDVVQNVYSKNIDLWFESLKSMDSTLINDDLLSTLQEPGDIEDAVLVDNYLPRQLGNCQICNDTKIEEESIDDCIETQCKRCGLDLSYTNELLSGENLNRYFELNNLETLFNINEVKFSKDETDLTNTLYKIWQDDDIEEMNQE